MVPKTTSPSSLSQCRNISCTNFLSKVLEGVILTRLREEIAPDPVQYGGIKGSSVEHLLVLIWERILGSLEIPDVAVTLLGIDYEKAFNRMCHNECLAQLARLGASQESLSLVASFLSDRVMQARVGTVTSAPRKISAGSPQGSILGCFLYCITTQQLGQDLVSLNTNPGPSSPDHVAMSESAGAGRLDQTMMVSTPVATRAMHGGLDWDSLDSSDSEQDLSPDIHGDSCLGPNARFLRGTGRQILDSSSSEDPASSDDSFRTARDESADIFDFLADVFKYVDDTTVVEAVELSDAKKHFTTGTPTSSSRARYSELTANAIKRRADQIGMRINCKKTQLLVISPPNGYLNNVHVTVGEEKIESSKSMKLLGFVFG